jgi:hypothetical protein
MEQRPSWEANSFSASQEIPRILWNTEVHYCIHKSPPPVLMRMKLPLKDECEKLESINHQKHTNLTQQMQEGSKILHFELYKPIHYILTTVIQRLQHGL